MTIQNKIAADLILDLMVSLEPKQLEEIQDAAEALREAWQDPEIDRAAQYEEYTRSHAIVRNLIKRAHYSQVDELLVLLERAGVQMKQYEERARIYGGVRT